MERRELIAWIVLVVASAAHVTNHVAICWTLARRDPWWRGLVALGLPPLAPFWAYEEGLRLRSAIWVLTLCAYGLALTVSLL